MFSTTLSVEGTSSSIFKFIQPEIELDERFNYSCALLSFQSYHSIPNVHEGNNKFHYLAKGIANSIDEFNVVDIPVGSEKIGDIETFVYEELHDEFEVITIPVGSYEIEDIAKFLCEELNKPGIMFSLLSNKNTWKTIIKSNLIIDLSRDDSIGSVLGFAKKKLYGSERYESDKTANIQDTNVIRIECDLTNASYHNGERTHTIHEFTPKVDPGHIILENPKNLIYLPVVRRRINTLSINIVDQHGKLVDFRGETISCRIHIKSD